MEHFTTIDRLIFLFHLSLYPASLEIAEGVKNSSPKAPDTVGGDLPAHPHPPRRETPLLTKRRFRFLGTGVDWRHSSTGMRPMPLSPRSVLFISLAGLGAVLVWAASIPDQIAVSPKDCQPQGTAHIAALVHGNDFWQGQQRLLAAERDRLLALPAKLDLAKEAQGKEHSALDAHLNRLSRGGAEQEERDQAAAQRYRSERLGWVLKCEAKAREKMN